jgi:hypothetical protein
MDIHLLWTATISYVSAFPAAGNFGKLTNPTR